MACATGSTAADELSATAAITVSGVLTRGSVPDQRDDGMPVRSPAVPAAPVGVTSV